jgi:hypothetical protein
MQRVEYMDKFFKFVYVMIILFTQFLVSTQLRNPFLSKTQLRKPFLFPFENSLFTSYIIF